MPPANWPENELFPAYRPLPEGGVELKIGESQLMMLPPGFYHFAVSYPPPNQIASSMYVRIPELLTGADDNVIDQTITITGDDASSDDSITNASLQDFIGSWEEINPNLPPNITCNANVPAGVAVANTEPGVTALPSRRITVGPIVATELDATAVELTGVGVDPEGDMLDYYWTWSQFSTLPTKESAASGEEVNWFFRPNPRREGRYDVYLTAYDSFHLFNECHWEIIVRGNEKPIIEVIADDYVIDFGRFGTDRINGDSSRDRNDLGPPISGAPSWCDYIDTGDDGVADTTLLKTLPILPTSESPNHIYRPTQFPNGMTCLYAMIGDEDDDPLEVAYRFPFGGDLYNALTGMKITTADQLDAYNATLTSLVTSFPIPPILAPFAPEEADFALPIIWEAPDNISGTAATDASTPTHDCRHLHEISDEVGPCVDVPGNYPAGGITAIVATVTDGISREQIDDFGVGYGEDNIIRLKEDVNNGGSSSGSGQNPDDNKPPICSDDSVTTNMGQSVTVPISAVDPDLGDTVEYTITSGPSHGNLEGNSYTPDGSYSGVDSFTFVASDGKANSDTCTVEITINEVRKYYVFKLAGTGYHKRWGGYAEKLTGYEHFYRWAFPSEIDGIVGTHIDNTTACENGPWAGPVLTPSIWESREVTLLATLDTYEEMEQYRCDVPNWVFSNPICNGWQSDSDPKYWDNINSICGN